ncbi:MAG: ATP-binding protein [Gemmatimonadota bacterium]|nr:ATP-binding protein [Gemmatimonadota bacterium]
MSPHSFYVGPGKPLLRVTGWDDLVAAAQAGVLAETQWVELKAALPAKANVANLELARDLASLSVDGGVLVIGVKNPGNQADHLVGTTDDLENLKSRIDQVAGSTRIQPPLTVQMTPIPHPTDPERYVLIVTVPASASAPHMVDEKYWGRGATGKRPLADVEVSRLFAQRRGRRDDLRERLLGLSTGLDPLQSELRQHGHLYVMAEPTAAWVGPPLAETLGSKHPLQMVGEALSFRPQSSPRFESLTFPVPHPDGLALASVDLGSTIAEVENSLLYLLVTDSGSVQLVSGHGTRTYGDQTGINSCHIMEIVHQAIELTTYLGMHYLNHSGTWNIGVHVEGLEGLLPSQALVERTKYDFGRFTPFQTNEYTRIITATTKLAENTPGVVEKLLRDLARGLGLANYLFPYSTPAEICR